MSMTQEQLDYELIMAIKRKEFGTVLDYIKLGANVNCRIGKTADTPLVVCIKNYDPDIFYQLVKNGADVTKRVGPEDVEDYKKPSLLYYAMFNDIFKERAFDTYKLILENGGDRDINYAPKGQQTPAEKAYIEGNGPVFELFKKYADVRISMNLMKEIQELEGREKNKKK